MSFSVIEITALVLFVSQLIGIFLRAIEDGLKAEHAGIVVIRMLMVYTIFIFIPVIMLWRLWVSKEWADVQDWPLKRKTRLTLLTIFTSHYFFVKISLEEARENMYENREKLRRITEQPVQERLTAFVY